MSLATQHQKQNLDYLKSLAKVASDSRQYSNMTETSLLNLMLSATDLGISPMKALNGGFYVVNGKVCMSTALMADRIRKAGHSIKIKAMTRDKCIIYAVRKDNGDEISFEYTMEDANLAGIAGSMTWKKYPKQMLYNRCMSSVARILFSDVVGNSYSEEERFDIQNIPAEKRPLEDQEPEQLVDATGELSGNPGTLLDEPLEYYEKLSEAQCAELDSLLIEDKEMTPKILNQFKIERVYDLKPENFERVARHLRKRKEDREVANV